jgi:glycosyltransferase involved in cell wall biosynthesis
MKVMLAALYPGGPGTNAYTRSLAHALLGQGHEVVVADRASEAVGLLPAGVSVVPLPRQRARLRRRLGALEGWRVHGEIERLGRELQIDVLHATYPELGVASTWPTVVTARDPVLSPLRRAVVAPRRGEAIWDEFLFGISDWWRCRRATAVVAYTKEVEQAIARKHRCVRRIPLCIPDEEIHEPTARRSQDCFLAAATLDDPRKGLDLALEAVASVRRSRPDMRLVLLGGWREPERARTLPKFCDVRGFVPRHEVTASLRNAGCFLLPSLWEEGGNVAIEALAAGAPVVSSPLPALVDVQSQGLVLVPTRDPDSFARAIAAAVEIEKFAFPDAWRASMAGALLTDLYASLRSA